ncbi:hypothetical protein ABZ894_32700 [Nocardia beijingensis]|uniref:hypothetical protein n=1 Tax=Nocardia beijingensis TaxID=95162 RepID=UPI0033FC91AB
MAAYLSTPGLPCGFRFELEEPMSVARQVGIWQRDRLIQTVDPLGDDAGGPSRVLFVINWAAYGCFYVDEAIPSEESARANGQMLVDAFLDEAGKLTLYHP